MRELDPVKATFPNPNKVICKDCVFRDKGKMKIEGKEVNFGVTKSECEIFQKPNYKPREILFDNANCEYYVSETFEKNRRRNG